MISSGKRTTRSRFSSPAHLVQQNDENGIGVDSGPLEPSKSSANDSSRKRTFMDAWLEPSVQNKSSYEEDGLMKHGVVENMAPLGALPKLKKTGSGGENGRPLTKPRIILRPSLKGVAKAAQDPSLEPLTPSTAEAVVDGGEEEEKQEEDVVVVGSAAVTSTSNPPLNTNTTSAAASQHYLPSSRTSKRKSLPGRPTVVVQDNEDADYDPGNLIPRKHTEKPSAPKRGRPPTSVRQASMVSAALVSPVKLRSTTPPPPPPRESHGPEFVAKVVEAAVDDALYHYRYPTAFALRILYDEKSDDAAFVSMIEEVFSQSADVATMKKFCQMMEKKKREGKKDNTARDYFIPPDDTGVTPHPPMPAPYAKLIHGSAVVVRDEGEARASKKIKISHRRNHSHGTDIHLTPRKMGVGKINTPSSRRRARRESGASDSSLSSVEHLSSPELPENSDLTEGATFASPSLRGTARARAKATAKAQAKAKAKPKDKTISSLNANESANASAETAKALAKGRAQAQTQALNLAQAQEAGATTTEPQSPLQYSTRPITTRRKSLASTKHAQEQQADASGPNSPTPFDPHSPTHNSLSFNAQDKVRSSTTARDDASMPGRIVSTVPEYFSAEDKSGLIAPKGASKTSMSNGGRDDAWEKRKEAQKVTNGYYALESFIRDEEDREVTPMRTTRKTRQSLMPSAASARATRSTQKRVYDDSERLSSPGLFSIPGDGSSIAGSRAVTPTTGLRAAKKQKTGLRVKSSPVKKKGGTAAGVPRSVSEAQSSATNGAAKDQIADNDEYCSACGNAGDVVCCDGCPRSFHFECVDMPRSETLPDEWYCNECLVKRYPSRVPVHKGVFGPPLNALEKMIPRAFSLPKKVQNRFEGVKAGADGDYEEITTSKMTTRRKTNGYEEAPDFFKQRDDGEAVLCHDCMKPATDARAIIPCSACPLHWHLDCLDPPLAIPPVLKTWKCPAHADELLQLAPPLAPAHRYRKLKNVAAITPAISRGLRNNGHIEIDWSSEPEEDDKSGWRDVASFGRTYKVSEKGVRLDFIEQLRNQGAGYAPARDERRWAEPYLTPPVEDTPLPKPTGFEGRNVEEMQASLVLSSLKSSPTNGLEQLTSALLSSAEPNVISLIAQGDAGNIAQDAFSNHDKVSLRALLAQIETMGDKIRQMLGSDDLPALPPSHGRQGPRSTIADSKSSMDKMDSEPLVTEPTPPSTIDHEGAMEFD